VLVLSRKVGESIVIGSDIVVQVLRIRGGEARLGISAPDAVPIRRAELPPKRRAEPAPLGPAADPEPPGPGRPGRHVAGGRLTHPLRAGRRGGSARAGA
jgi:carbon storage regulator